MFGKNPRYIGVTDVADSVQAHMLCDVVSDISDIKVHIGVMTSWRTINENKVPDEWNKVWLPPEKLHAPFTNNPKAFNVLHYVDYAEVGRSNGSDLIKAYSLGGKYIHGIQLDMIWPSLDILDDFKSEYCNAKIILQVGRKALNTLAVKGNLLQTCLKLAAKLDFYLYLVDYVLLDMSGGQDIPIDVESAEIILKELTDHFGDDFSFAVAGGLSSVSVDNLRDIFKTYKDLSIDAQGRLRPSKDFHDLLDLNMALAYVKRGYEIMAASCYK